MHPEEPQTFQKEYQAPVISAVDPLKALKVGGNEKQ
jgi:hypothetical protein